MSRILAFSGLSVALLVAAFFFVASMKKESNAFVQNKRNAVEILNFENRLLTTKEWFFTEHEGRRKVLEAETQYKEADKHYSNAQQTASWLVGFMVLYLGLIFALGLGTKLLPKFLSFGLVVVCLVLLSVGIMIPMLEIGAFNQELTIQILFSTADIPILSEIPYLGEIEIDEDVVFEGRMYYYYQNKSITDIIGLLWTSQNYVVAIAIIGFSIGIPVIKLTGTAFFIVYSKSNVNNKLYKFLGKLGKWSMADVFVVAAFLAYLSFKNMNTGIDTEANTLFGLYFFLSYVILSIVVSYVSNWAIKQEVTDRNLSSLKQN
jgi:hypothetical protein